VGISGGRDSSYVLLKLVKDYDIKVLAVNYENPFTVPQAKANIENAVKALKVDLVQFKDKDNKHKRVFKEAVIAWFKKPSPALIPIICLGCKPAWLEIYQISKKHNIQLIITGGNPFEVISFKKELVNISRDENSDKAFLKYYYSIRDIVKNSAYFTPTILLTAMKSYLWGNPRSLGLRLFGAKITWIELFNFIKWDEEEIISRIRDELFWNYPHELKSTWRFDCRVHHLLNFMYMKTLGMTESHDFFAKMVRENQITRENAIERLGIENGIHMDEIELVLEQAGIENTSLLDGL
jgi:hypothetical protein